MIIDCHGHYTTEPKYLHRFRKEQTEAANAKDKSKMPARSGLKMSDDEIKEKLRQPARRPRREIPCRSSCTRWCCRRGRT